MPRFWVDNARVEPGVVIKRKSPALVTSVVIGFWARFTYASPKMDIKRGRPKQSGDLEGESGEHGNSTEVYAPSRQR
jgi:hypothetical protein